MRISDWSSDVCSSDLACRRAEPPQAIPPDAERATRPGRHAAESAVRVPPYGFLAPLDGTEVIGHRPAAWSRGRGLFPVPAACRSEEHTSELQSLMRISYAVFCLKKKKIHN